MLVPSGICTSTRTSGRSEVGKNCFLTAPMPTPAIRKTADHRTRDEQFAAHRPGDHAAQATVAGRVVDRLVPALGPA